MRMSAKHQDIYMNQLLPKLDELAAICATDNPDIVCLVETWLCSDVLDNEVLIPNYSTVRLDRNRYGGRVLLCTFMTVLLLLYKQVQSRSSCAGSTNVCYAN